MSDLVTIAKTEEMVAAAKDMGSNLGIPGGLIVFGMLINEGLHKVAEAVRGSGNIANAIKDLAKANRGQ